MQNTSSNSAYLLKLYIDGNYNFNLNHSLLLTRSKYPLLAGLLLVLSSCGGMRNVEKDRAKEQIVLDRSMSLQYLDRLKSERKIKSLLFKKDSSSGSYQVQIWPKGNFKFSADQGFEGNAAQVLVQGTTQQVGETLSKNVVAEQSDQLTSTALEKEGHSNRLEVSRAIKKQVSWKTLLGYALISFGFVACLILFRSILSAKKMIS
jgi:hypothetical protein